MTESNIMSGIPPLTWTDVSGMSVSMTVPSGEKALLLINYSMASTCVDQSGATLFCYVRILVDGTEAPPGQVIFESAADGNISSAIEANSMQFVAGPLNAGSHTIKVQAYMDESRDPRRFTTGPFRSFGRRSDGLGKGKAPVTTPGWLCTHCCIRAGEKLPRIPSRAFVVCNRVARFLHRSASSGPA